MDHDLRTLQSFFQDVISPTAMEYVTALTIHAASGEPLRTLRERAGLSQEKLAGLCGVSQPSLSQMETGKLTPSWETALQIYSRCHARIAKIPERQGYLITNQLHFAGERRQKLEAAELLERAKAKLRAVGGD